MRLLPNNVFPNRFGEILTNKEIKDFIKRSNLKPCPYILSCITTDKTWGCFNPERYYILPCHNNNNKFLEFKND